jgi:hypothetical protein
VRLAILLLFAALGLWARGDAIDDRFQRVDLDTLTGYIVPESYAEAHKEDFSANIPSTVRIAGFWTPSETSVLVADRVLREKIDAAVKDASVLFPGMAKHAAEKAYDPEDNLEFQQRELDAVAANYEKYTRQYVGIILFNEEKGVKERLIFCNYSIGAKVDASVEYVFTDKVFVPDGSVHFLQCRFDFEKKACVNVSMIGPWQAVERTEE